MKVGSPAIVGGVMLLWVASAAAAQGTVGSVEAVPVARIASLAPGSIRGTVEDERGLPVSGAVVSALGTTTRVAVTDHSGRFELRTLSPGPYLLRAHLSGYVASRAQVVNVRASSRTASSIALRRASTPGVLSPTPVVAAGLGPSADGIAQGDDHGADSAGTGGVSDNHDEMAWRLRHLRRSILKDVTTVPEEFVNSDTSRDPRASGQSGLFGQAVESSAHLATSLLAGTAFSGQVNLLTAGSFDTSQQLFSPNNLSSSIAYLAVGAPVGDRADWTARAALTQGDITSLIVAGEYITRTPARHRYELGWSYGTQRYSGSNLAAWSGVIDGSRSAGIVSGFDTFSMTPSLALTYGGSYARYDYLNRRSLVSPRVALTFEPAGQLRMSASVSRRAVGPGAEEFLPPSESGVIWLPPQRTFSALDPSRALQAERTNHFEVGVERDFATTTLSVRAFRQHVEDQIVTLFGVGAPGAASRLGHYFLGDAGAGDAAGLSAGLRASLAGRVHGSVEYSTIRARLTGGEPYLMLFAPSAIRLHSDRIHDVATSVETDVPETSTRVLVLYRVSNGFARSSAQAPFDRPSFDSRFDVQVHQSLPFMDFSTAKWEMLVGVDNFFRETAPDQSVYDELLVIRPPKRLVGGLTLKF
jgi:hypothetical protein